MSDYTETRRSQLDALPNELLPTKGGDDNLGAYYYSFSKTGIDEIDRILAAVASAGRASHGTSEWNDPDIFSYEDGNLISFEDAIQEYAQRAANRINELEAKDKS